MCSEMTIIQAIELISSEAQAWAHLGVREFSDGTKLVGKIPKLKEGYLFRFYGPLSEAEIENLEAECFHLSGMRLPEEYSAFLHYCNGVNFFQNALFVGGARRSDLLDRADFDAMHCLPFDILMPALTDKDDSPSKTGFRISKYDDGSLIFIEQSGEVLRVKPASEKCILNRWNTMGDWLFCEFKRLVPFFDQYGNVTGDRNAMELVPDAPN